MIEFQTTFFCPIELNKKVSFLASKSIEKRNKALFRKMILNQIAIFEHKFLEDKPNKN